MRNQAFRLTNVKIEKGQMNQRDFFWVGYSIISIAETASKKTGALVRSVKPLSSEFLLYLYKSTIRPCIAYCCHLRTGAANCFLDMLYKLPKWVCRAVSPTLAASPEPLPHCQNVASIWFMIDVTLEEDIYLSWLIWYLLLILVGSLFFILIICMIFCHHFWMF